MLAFIAIIPRIYWREQLPFRHAFRLTIGRLRIMCVTNSHIFRFQR
jgi:hypothetical protein